MKDNLGLRFWSHQISRHARRDEKINIALLAGFIGWFVGVLTGHWMTEAVQRALNQLIK